MTFRERCDYRYAHNLTTDLPFGPRCESAATHRIEWTDGRYSMGCDDHLTIDDSASVKPKSITPLRDVPRRFFRMENQGVSYSFVATDIDHCKRILCDHGAVVYDADDEEIQLRKGQYAEFEKADCDWFELTHDQASLKFTISDDGPAGEDYRAPLSERELGAFFCSEY